jgi:hypothetical protein
MNEIKRINASIVYIEDKLLAIRECEKKISEQIQAMKNCSVIKENECMPSSQKDEEKDDSEPWVSLMNFYIHTEIVSASCLSQLLRKDNNMFDCCAMRIGKKYYVKKEQLIQYLHKYSEGRILNNTNNYLKNREKEWKNETNNNHLPRKPLS